MISVDTRKKELVGNFKNGGREWHPAGQPERVDVHDFPGDAEGKAIPYGIYDLASNDGFVSVGVDHDTPVFAVKSFRPGTSKWNKVEHRLFSFISMNWRGRPLRSYETVINLLSNTTNYGGLVVRARIDRRSYPIGKKIPAREFRQLNIEPAAFHGDWNYVVKPSTSASLIGRLPHSRTLSIPPGIDEKRQVAGGSRLRACRIP